MVSVGTQDLKSSGQSIKRQKKQRNVSCLPELNLSQTYNLSKEIKKKVTLESRDHVEVRKKKYTNSLGHSVSVRS